ncbi:MAG: hypothetical protein ACYCS1_11635 [Gammaproteobacteria bacterium]
MSTSSLFVLRLAPFLAAFGLAFYATPALVVSNLALDECTNCTTVAAFQSDAAQNIPSGAYFFVHGTPHVEAQFLIFNPPASLAAAISVHGICLSTADGAPCQWDLTWVEETGTTAGMEQFFEEMAPSLAIRIPSSVATTFTGTAQSAAVSAWLDQEISGVPAPLGAALVTIFPDGSSAEYQVIGVNPTGYGFLSGSGHAANGQPENDSGEQVSSSTYTQLTPSLAFNISALIKATIAQEAAADKADIGIPIDNLNTSGTVSLSTALSLTAANGGPSTGQGSQLVSTWCMSSGSTAASCQPPPIPPKGG